MVETYYKKFAPLHPYYENQMSGKQMAFVNCAVDFRRRELLMEGGRWFDIKRFLTLKLPTKLIRQGNRCVGTS